MLAVFVAGLTWASAMFKMLLNVQRGIDRITPKIELMWPYFERLVKGGSDDAGQD